MCFVTVTDHCGKERNSTLYSTVHSSHNPPTVMAPRDLQFRDLDTGVTGVKENKNLARFVKRLSKFYRVFFFFFFHLIQKSKVQMGQEDTGQMNRRYCISYTSSSRLLLTCLAVCAGSTASSPCTRPPSPPSQVGSCAPDESPFSTQDDCPYSEGGTWTDKGSESDRARTTAFVCVCFYSGSTWLTPQHPQRGTPPLGRSNRECGSLDTCLLTEQRISR